MRDSRISDSSEGVRGRWIEVEGEGLVEVEVEVEEVVSAERNEEGVRGRQRGFEFVRFEAGGRIGNG